MSILKNLMARFAAKQIREDKNMKKVLEFLQGKKSYVVLALGLISGGATALGYVIPEWIFVLLAGILGVTFKAGQNRSEALMKELVEEIKKTNGTPKTN